MAYPSNFPANNSSRLRMSVSEAGLRLFPRLFCPSDLNVPLGGRSLADVFEVCRNHIRGWNLPC